MTPKDARERQEIEELLPWYATGKLGAADAKRVEEALAREPEVSRDHARVRAELAETVLLNESLGAPSSQALESLFAKIDAEARPRGAVGNMRRGLGIWLAERLSRMQPNVLGWAAAAAVVALVLQAGLLTALVTRGGGEGGFETASAPAAGGTVLLLGFQPGATAADITALLEANGASVIEGPRAGGFYRVRIADGALPKEELDRILAALRGQTGVVRFAAPVGG